MQKKQFRSSCKVASLTYTSYWMKWQATFYGAHYVDCCLAAGIYLLKIKNRNTRTMCENV